MEMYTTALGRAVPIDEPQTVLKDSVLRLLFDYRINPLNPTNVPMKLSDIVSAVSAAESLVIAALEMLRGESPPKIEERERFQQERTFRISAAGVHFAANMPLGRAGLP